jgi:DMSO/TMAO reductase YedYZ heme-binding membrane subunit
MESSHSSFSLSQSQSYLFGFILIKFDVKKKEIGALIKWNKLHILRNIFYILPCVHWSLPNWERKPWLKEGVLNGLLLAESITCIYQSIC